ncbi:MAG: phosphoglucosamine mutase [Phycisphaerales bacterium]|nr:phosphoglucosamine mutase [Phycisphaerales bacterium]
MTTAPLMLGVSGCRGLVGSSLTPVVALTYAGAFGSWLVQRHGDPCVVLARDGRAAGHAVHAAALAGLCSTGCRVIDLGVAMTPTVGVLVDRRRAHAGMVVTASHNPQVWNGLKCLLGDGSGRVSAAAPDARLADEIIARFRSGEPAWTDWAGTGALTRELAHNAEHAGVTVDAIEAITGRGAQTLGAGLRVVIDSVNASGIVGARAMAEALGFAAIHHLGAQPSGLFPHPPEPVAENLASLGEAVRRTGAAVGFAQDPDADRLALIDERGAYVGEEYTLALGARCVLECMGERARGATLAANLSTSRMIDDLAARFGARVLRTRVGEANVVEAMKREGCVLGGEGNGGVIWPRITYIRDSLGAMALVTALLARHGKPLSALVAEMPAYAIEKRKVDLPTKEAATPAVAALARAHATEQIDTQDGIRIDWPARRAWLHVRASNTEPIMRLIAEAPERAQAQRILDDASRVIAGG